MELTVHKISLYVCLLEHLEYTISPVQDNYGNSAVKLLEWQFFRFLELVLSRVCPILIYLSLFILVHTWSLYKHLHFSRRLPIPEQVTKPACSKVRMNSNMAMDLVLRLLLKYSSWDDLDVTLYLYWLYYRMAQFRAEMHRCHRHICSPIARAVSCVSDTLGQ